MQGTVFKALLRSCEENDEEEQKEIGKKHKKKESGRVIDEIIDKFQCMNIVKREANQRDCSNEQHELLTPQKRRKARFRNHDVPGLHREKHGLWRQEQKTRAAKIEKQLKARRELEALIEEQLNRFHAHYNQAMVPSHLEDVSKLLRPQWAAPQELASLFWLGDWRPSAILELLHGLAPLSFISDSTASAMQPAISQFIHELRIEEAVIDEEMAEIQATCVLYLPFAPVNSSKSGGSASRGIQSEFLKIVRVITKAQKLRFKALELVVKKLLNQTEAAEFLVAFSGIQDAIHQFAEEKRLRKGPVTVSVKSHDVAETSKQPKILIDDRISHLLKTSDSSEYGQGIQYALSEFEELQGLQKGSVTQSARFQDVVETSNQPKIPLEDRTSSWDNLSKTSDSLEHGQGIQYALCEFEEQQALRKGPVTQSVRSQDVVETSNQPKIPLEDRMGLWDNLCQLLEQDSSGERIIDDINEPAGLPIESWDVVETSKQPMIHSEDRIGLWEEFSKMVGDMKSCQGIPRQL
ncbi:hypothetical protein ES332_A05G131600v1 [Gossypium tomentosum]|nr:hypothetical protein ES332_A05G131600v1 [Gossypium tomentosum]